LQVGPRQRPARGQRPLEKFTRRPVISGNPPRRSTHFDSPLPDPNRSLGMTSAPNTGGGPDSGTRFAALHATKDLGRHTGPNPFVSAADATPVQEISMFRCLPQITHVIL